MTPADIIVLLILVVCYGGVNCVEHKLGIYGNPESCLTNVEIVSSTVRHLIGPNDHFTVVCWSPPVGDPT